MSVIDELFSLCVKSHPDWPDRPLKAAQETLGGITEKFNEMWGGEHTFCIQMGHLTVYPDRVEMAGKVVVDT